MMENLERMRVAILVDDAFEQIEMTEPRKALDAAGAMTMIVSAHTPTVQGWNHHSPAQTFAVDVALRDAKAEEFDALLLPGGVLNPDTLRTQPEAVRFVRALAERGMPIAAICHGPWMLVEAGLAKGRKLTSWPSLQTDIRNAGGTWLNEPVVKDGDIVTSRKPDDLGAFNEKMLELFAESRGRSNGRSTTTGSIASPRSGAPR